VRQEICSLYLFENQKPIFNPPALYRITYRSSTMLVEGVWAEVKAGGEHLRLFSEHSPLGVQASVYNVDAKSWIAPSEPVDDIEQGKIEQKPMRGRT
jgi:hypothetical protein